MHSSSVNKHLCIHHHWVSRYAASYCVLCVLRVGILFSALSATCKINGKFGTFPIGFLLQSRGVQNHFAFLIYFARHSIGWTRTFLHPFFMPHKLSKWCEREGESAALVTVQRLNMVTLGIIRIIIILIITIAFIIFVVAIINIETIIFIFTVSLSSL